MIVKRRRRPRPALAEELEAAADAMELARPYDRGVGELELVGDGDGRERVEHVVVARHVEHELQSGMRSRSCAAP